MYLGEKMRSETACSRPRASTAGNWPGTGEVKIFEGESFPFRIRTCPNLSSAVEHHLETWIPLTLRWLYGRPLPV